MERQSFRYRGGGIFGEIGAGVTQYAGLIEGFRSWKSPEPGTSRIATDYTGLFRYSIVGGGPPTPIIGVTLGKVDFEGVPDASVHGSAWYASVTGGASTGYDRGEGWTFYATIPNRYKDYRSLPDSRGRRRVDRRIVSDISSGAHTPWIWPQGNKGIDRWVRDNLYGVRALIQAQIYLYEQINYYSYGPGESAEDPNDPPQ